MTSTRTIAGKSAAAKGGEVFGNTLILVGEDVSRKADVVNRFASELKRFGVNTDMNSYALDEHTNGLHVIAGKSVFGPNEALEAALIGAQREGKLTEETFHGIMRDRFAPVMSVLKDAKSVRKGNVEIYPLFD